MIKKIIITAILFACTCIFIISPVMAQSSEQPNAQNQPTLSDEQVENTQANDSDENKNNPILPDGGSVKKYIPRYESGQAGVSVGLGAIFPLFFQKFTGEYIRDTRLTAGGSIWFEFDIFLWQALSAGMEIGGMFALTPNSRTLFMAPLTVHIKYTFQAFPVEFPISFAVGANIASLENNFKISFILKPKVGVTYRINQNWSAGLFVSYWWVVQSYEFTLGNEVSRLGNFMDVSAGFSYVF